MILKDNKARKQQRPENDNKPIKRQQKQRPLIKRQKSIYKRE